MSARLVGARGARGQLFRRFMPSAEDAAIPEAATAGLPILTTTNGPGPDIVREGLTGWVFPIRRPDAFIERLQWCDKHRLELAAMVQLTHDTFKSRDEHDMAVNLVEAFVASRSR